MKHDRYMGIPYILHQSLKDEINLNVRFILLSFVFSQKLKIHTASVHGRIKPFKCNRCDQILTQRICNMYFVSISVE